MFSIVVANIKGGCGKTTIATQLAAAFAGTGQSTLLADVDRQRSSLGWLSRRPETAAVIDAADWSKELGAVPKHIQRLVIDAPAALRTKDMEDLIKMADVVILPVLPSAFDEHATERFIGKLDSVKAIAKRRTKVLVVGNRLRPRTLAAAQLERFLGGIGYQVAAQLRDSQIYADLAANGLSLFDLPGRRAADYRADWQPLLAELDNAAFGDEVGTPGVGRLLVG